VQGGVVCLASERQVAERLGQQAARGVREGTPFPRRQAQAAVAGRAGLHAGVQRWLTLSTGKWEVRAASTACMAAATSSCCAVHCGVAVPSVAALGLAPRSVPLCTLQASSSARWRALPRPPWVEAPPLALRGEPGAGWACGPTSRWVMAAAWQMARRQEPASLGGSA
jgi:hypothetical protein